jgi:putative ABC transport system permease protein
MVVVSPAYFEVWSVRALEGRVFTESDTSSSIQVALVNKDFVNKFLTGQDPIGKRFRTIGAGNQPDAWRTVVGLVPNIVQDDISPRQIDPVIYVPLRQREDGAVAIIAKTSVPPGTLGKAFQRELQAVDPNMAVFNLWTMPERLERNYFFQQSMGVLFGVFAGIALLLASVGLYAVIGQSVSQRTQEIGIRIALGSTTRGILLMVLKQGITQLVIGLVIGLAGGLAVTRILKASLVQVSPSDPTAFVGAALVLTFAAVIGCLIPACRAMSVDPVVALHHE